MHLLCFLVPHGHSQLSVTDMVSDVDAWVASSFSMLLSTAQFSMIEQSVNVQSIAYFEFKIKM